MFESLINLFFPKSCVGCHSLLLKDELVICIACRHEIPQTNHHKTINNETMQKFYGRIPLEFAASLLYFHKKGIVQEMIHKLKYKGHEEIGQTLGNWYAEDLKNIDKIQSVDMIIPVPLHPKKLRERGYNQVTKFGQSLANQLHVPMNNSVLVRTVYSKTQTRKNLLGRTDVIENIFDVVFSQVHHNKHFLLIDDVITTGSTLEACSRALLKIPGAKISIVSMAMTHN